MLGENSPLLGQSADAKTARAAIENRGKRDEGVESGGAILYPETEVT